MPISALNCVRPAFAHAEQQLFRPFRFGQWWRLAIVVFLAGEAGGGGCNYHFPSGSTPSPSTTTASSAPVDLSALGEYLPMIALVVVFAVLLMVVLIAIGSVFRFILYEAVAERRCRIRASWWRWQTAGLRYFLWQLILFALTFVLVIAAIGGPLWYAYRGGWFNQPASHVSDFIIAGLIFVPLLILVILTVAIVRVLANDFAVPVMALEDVGVLEAWRRARQRVVTSRKDLAVYLLVKALLAIVAAIGFGILGIVAIVLLVIVFGIPTLFVALGLSAAGVGWNAFTIVLVVLAGLAFFAAVLCLTALLAVPKTVFFVAFSQLYVADRYPALAEWRGRALSAITT